MVSVLTHAGESLHFDAEEVRAAGVDWTWLLRDRLEAKLGVSGYRLRFLSDGDVSYVTKCWEEVGCPSEMQVVLLAHWHSEKRLELCNAAELGTIDVVRRLLEATANPDGQTQEEEDEEDDSDPDFDLFDFDDTQVKRCPLWLAAKYGHDEVIRLLLHAKADKERVAPDGSTALIAACSAGPHTTAAVATLLAAKAHFETSDDAGMTVLGYAARAGFPEAVRQLLEAKAMQVWDGKGRTPLLWCAAEKGSRFVEVAKLLLQHAAEVNATSDHGSPLTSAVPSADAGMTCALLEARAKVNQPDQFSQSALWLACRYGRKDLLDPLLTARADVEQTDAHQVSPVECCALFAEDVEMVKQLVQLGASTEKLLDQWEEMRQMACCDDEDLEDVTEYIEVLRAAKECTKSWLKG